MSYILKRLKNDDIMIQIKKIKTKIKPFCAFFTRYIFRIKYLFIHQVEEIYIIEKMDSKLLLMFMQMFTKDFSDRSLN